MRYLLTGHTGFKGSWLAAMLTEQGHEVSGVALDPEPGSLFLRANVRRLLVQDHRVDIRDASALRDIVRRERPSVVLHLAAQPLVRLSYARPQETMEVNAVGTMNVLDAIRDVDSVEAALIVTTDKVYRNDGRRHGYIESDPLGGRDPYSASKAMADILTWSWTSSYDLPPTLIARAGNVIGGGDAAQDRLFPDLIRAWSRGDVAMIRNGDAIRPWQHVLDCLNGYLMGLAHVRAAGEHSVLNFGPLPDQVHRVRELVAKAAQFWGGSARWDEAIESGPHEETVLLLDSSKARRALGWEDKLSFESAVDWTVAWEKSAAAGRDPLEALKSQIQDFAVLG